MRVRYEQNARRNLHLTGELFRILDCLDAHHIPAIPYKGPTLAEKVYGDLALRDFSDLDVLVRHFTFCVPSLRFGDLGYEPNIKLTQLQESAYLASGYEYTFDGPAGRNLLEIQWGIVPRFYAVDFSMEGLFERARLSELNGAACRRWPAKTCCWHSAYTPQSTRGFACVGYATSPGSLS